MRNLLVTVAATALAAGVLAGCKSQEKTCIQAFEKAKKCKLTNVHVAKGKDGFVAYCKTLKGNALKDLEAGAKGTDCGPAFANSMIPKLTPENLPPPPTTPPPPRPPPAPAPPPPPAEPPPVAANHRTGAPGGSSPSSGRPGASSPSGSGSTATGQVG
jgi:hypothetical protein